MSGSEGDDDDDTYRGSHGFVIREGMISSVKLMKII